MTRRQRVVTHICYTILIPRPKDVISVNRMTWLQALCDIVVFTSKCLPSSVFGDIFVLYYTTTATMTEKETTHPPTGPDIGSSPMTPAAKRIRMGSLLEATAQGTDSTVPAQRDSTTIEDDTAVHTIRTTVGEDHVEEFDDATRIL